MPMMRGAMDGTSLTHWSAVSARQADLELLPLDAAGAQLLDGTSGAALGDGHIREAVVDLDLADLGPLQPARLTGQRPEDVARPHLVLATARDVQSLHGRGGSGDARPEVESGGIGRGRRGRALEARPDGGLDGG